MAQLMPLPLTVSCFSKIQIGFTFLVTAHLCSPGKRAVKRGCMCVCVTVVVLDDPFNNLPGLNIDIPDTVCVCVCVCVNVPICIVCVCHLKSILLRVESITRWCLMIRLMIRRDSPVTFLISLRSLLENSSMSVSRCLTRSVSLSPAPVFVTAQLVA